MVLPLLLLLLAGGHSSAFVPTHIVSTPGNRIQHHDENEHDDIFYTTTKLCAQKKKKVSQMPTLPVTSSSSSSSTSDFYSTSKTISTPMVVMDVENIRGATSFRISHEALLSRIRLWREDRLSMAPSISSSSNDDEDGDDWNLLEPLIWVCDHGMSPSIHHYSLFPNDEDESNKLPHNFGAIFAGDRTADDVIVDLVQLRCGGLPSYHIESNNNVDYEGDSLDLSDDRDDVTRNTTIVITADARLISRCQQARRQSSSLSDVIFVEPASLLQQLERYRINSHEEESLFGEALVQASTHQITTPSAKNIDVDSGGKRSDGKTSTMTSFKDSSIAAQQHAKFQARFQKSSPDAETSSQQPQEESDNSAAIAAQLKTEQIRRQMLLSDAYYLARPSKRGGRKSQSTMAAIHANYKNRNISKKQQKKMYVKRFGKKRKEDLANAAMKRKQLAAKLQLNLERASKGRLEDDDGNGDRVPINQSRSVRGGAELLETLLGWFEERRTMIDKKEIHQSGFKKPEQHDPTTSLLGLTSGQVGMDDKVDPLGSVVNVPLRGEQVQSSSKSVAPLRMVVISDTHGFEGALSKFSDDNEHSRSDDFLLPQADLLLHCGDFAASGSRKTQRAAARRLDEFLARQTHIPEKIIVQGNHDPDSPAKVLFPSSKAIYVRSSSTITVNGVHFALEPFSRRMAYRNIRRNVASTSPSDFPKCDILVSHEPPKHILDLTYHGFSAGSFHLKDLVERAENKPRMWACGHIHESRGILSHQFQPDGANNEDECEATIVINASNANSGRANRIVSGAVVVEVERLSSNNGEHQSAESTLQSRTTYEYLGNGEDSGLAMAGMDGMELNEYASRPGVRRRKGIPLSVRQQMKQVRSTLVQSQNQGS